MNPRAKALTATTIACAACCAVPLIASTAALGSLAALVVALTPSDFAWAASAALVSAALAFAVWHRKRRTALCGNESTQIRWTDDEGASDMSSSD